MAVDRVARQMANEALENGGGGGGSGGTTNYNQLENKPKINGVALIGDKSAADLGIPIVSMDISGETLIFTNINNRKD